MQYRELGSTGLLVSEIAMGCEGFAEDGLYRCGNDPLLRLPG